MATTKAIIIVKSMSLAEAVIEIETQKLEVIALKAQLELNQLHFDYLFETIAKIELQVQSMSSGGLTLNMVQVHGQEAHNPVQHLKIMAMRTYWNAKLAKKNADEARRRVVEVTQKKLSERYLADFPDGTLPLEVMAYIDRVKDHYHLMYRKDGKWQFGSDSSPVSKAN